MHTTNRRHRLPALLVSVLLALAAPMLTTTAHAETDTDGDGVVDADDADDDNDGVDDLFDTYPLDPDRCQDLDADGADDCSVGTDDFGPLADNDPSNDGPDCDGDGIVDATDGDDNGDGIADDEQADVCFTVDVQVFAPDPSAPRGVAALPGWHARVASLDGATDVAFVIDDVGFNGPWIPFADQLRFCVTLEDGYEFVDDVPDATGTACRAHDLPSGTVATSVGFDVVEVTSNEPPVADAAGPYLLPVGGSVILDGSGSSDPDGDALSHDWTVDGGTLDDPAAATPSYTAGDTAGVFDATLTVDDGNGGTDTHTTSIVVYDPEGGFVTGGGWYESATEACLDAAVCGDSAGRASFGFVAKYKQGRSVPDGQTHLTFEAGGLRFASTAYEALVVSSDQAAQYWGVGALDGEGGYRFRVTVTDDAADGDTFRFQLWAPDAAGGGLVYDNGSGTLLGGGEVKIHRPRG